MPLFAYTSIKIIDGKVHEHDEMIHGPNKDSVNKYLNYRGIIIRDLREADYNDTMLARLRTIRDNMSTPAVSMNVTKPIGGVRWMFWFLVVVLIITVWLIWRSV